MNSIKDFVNGIVSGDTVSAQSSFDALLRDKVRTVLEIKKVELTSQIYNRPSEASDQD